MIVLDRDLPCVHGDTLCRMITADDDDPGMILTLTAADAPSGRVAGLALARPKPTSKRRALRAAGIELDQIARTASRDGRQLDLLTKEFADSKRSFEASPIPGTQKSHESGEDVSPTRARR